MLCVKCQSASEIYLAKYLKDAMQAFGASKPSPLDLTFMIVKSLSPMIDVIFVEVLAKLEADTLSWRPGLSGQK